jgi:hypothetical protein
MAPSPLLNEPAIITASYMTDGVVVMLGIVVRNVGAGMTGDILDISMIRSIFSTTC